MDDVLGVDKMIRTFIAIVVFALIPVLGSADTINVPGDQPTIQDAIDIAVDGDTILVAPGTYLGNYLVQTKLLNIVSSHGPEVTILKPATINQSIIKFDNSLAGTVFEGFTVRDSDYKGIYCYFAHCIIRGNIIIDNNLENSAGGIYSFGSNLVIVNNCICNNITFGEGGGIEAYVSSLWITNNFIYNNLAYNIHTAKPPFPEYAIGGGIYLNVCTAYITNCIVYQNEVSDDGYWIFGIGSGIYGVGGTVYVTNSLVWNNTGATQIEGYDFYVNYCALEETYSGIGNTYDDPKLNVVSETQFNLDAASPCIDAGHNSAPGIQDYDAKGMPRTIDGNGDNTSIADIGVNEFLMLSADTYTLSESTGGSINFALDAGSDDAFRNYLILGCVSGTSPGTPLPGGYVTLPLNWDAVTDQIWALTNSPALIDFLGILDANGQATAQLNIGPLPGTAGSEFYFAFTCNNPFDIASHPMKFVVVP